MILTRRKEEALDLLIKIERVKLVNYLFRSANPFEARERTSGKRQPIS